MPDRNQDTFESEISTNEMSEQTPRSPRAKPYEKPEIIYHAPLEAMASVCSGAGGKANAGCTVTFS